MTTTRAAHETEAILERHFRQSVQQQLGGRVFKFAPLVKGNPDRLVLLPGGRRELVELKTVTGRLSLAQKVWIDRAAELGTTVHVLYGRLQIDQWVAEQA